MSKDRFLNKDGIDVPNLVFYFSLLLRSFYDCMLVFFLFLLVAFIYFLLDDGVKLLRFFGLYKKFSDLLISSALYSTEMLRTLLHIMAKSNDVKFAADLAIWLEVNLIYYYINYIINFSIKLMFLVFYSCSV